MASHLCSLASAFVSRASPPLPLFLLKISLSFGVFKAFEEEGRNQPGSSLQASTSKDPDLHQSLCGFLIEARQLRVAVSDLKDIFSKCWIREDQDLLSLVIISNLS